VALPSEPFFELLVETFDTGRVSGRHGTKHVRPVEGQGIDTSLVVECNREMRTNYETATMFVITAKFSNREGGKLYLKSPSPWGYTVVTEQKARDFLRSLQNTART
jgi:hypothetical protein